ncbi:unnamed protein product [Ceratitis capitata]|uniref:(Mediterranean fruit fly) hypothetical protein n=1 Tax=Ceratitis capitata TaxID=7213 RepID=A0A811U5X9_CERCA|nr:unnamed protein product [Ceratitis capitata]
MQLLPARNDVPSMYIEEDALNDEEALAGTRSADIRAARVLPSTLGPRCSASTTSSQHHYISEGFIQYAQPSLNGDHLIPLLDCKNTTSNTSNTNSGASSRRNSKNFAVTAIDSMNSNKGKQQICYGVAAVSCSKRYHPSSYLLSIPCGGRSDRKLAPFNGKQQKLLIYQSCSDV